MHVGGGIIAFLFGSTALIARKGGRLHRLSGIVFAVSMLCMAASGGYLALLRSQRVNTIAGVSTFYLVATGWMTIKRKPNETGSAEVGLFLLGLVTGITALTFAHEAATRASGKGGGAAAAYTVFGAIVLLSVSGDLRMLIRGGVSGVQRLVRHLWRMCVALFVAAGSFFLGTAGDPVLRRIGLRARLFPDAVRKTGLPAVPVLIIVVLTIFWLIRVRFTNAYKPRPVTNAEMVV
jgi:uncharacterized membrane protein